MTSFPEVATVIGREGREIVSHICIRVLGGYTPLILTLVDLSPVPNQHLLSVEVRLLSKRLFLLFIAKVLACLVSGTSRFWMLFGVGAVELATAYGTKLELMFCVGSQKSVPERWDSS